MLFGKSFPPQTFSFPTGLILRILCPFNVQRQHSSKYNKSWNDTVMEDLHNIEMMWGDFVEKLQTTGHCAEDVLVYMLVRVEVFCSTAGFVCTVC